MPQLIGVPRETFAGEKRVATVPEVVEKLVKLGFRVAVEAGATAVIQPGGSMRDDEVIAAADAHGVAMIFTGTRHFRH